MDVSDQNFDILYFIDSTLVVNDVWLPEFEYDLSLPTGITCLNCFDIDFSKITTLPLNLKVGGSCLLEDTEISHIPPCLNVGHNLVLSGSKVKLPFNVGGDIILD